MTLVSDSEKQLKFCRNKKSKAPNNVSKFHLEVFKARFLDSISYNFKRWFHSICFFHSR